MPDPTVPPTPPVPLDALLARELDDGGLELVDRLDGSAVSGSAAEVSGAAVSGAAKG